MYFLHLSIIPAPLRPTIVKTYQGVIGYDDQSTFAIVIDGPDPNESDFDTIGVRYNPADGNKPEYQEFDGLTQADLPITVVLDGLTAGLRYTIYARAVSGGLQSTEAIMTHELGKQSVQKCIAWN